MSIISKITGASAGEFIKTVGAVADKFITTQDEKLKFLTEFEAILQKRDSEIEQTVRKEIDAKMQVVVAEINQGDNYTKRARPTIVYFGLFATFFNYMLIPLMQLIFGIEVKPFDLPAEFWMAWGGVTGVYAVGRSMEKNGVVNRGTSLMTGSGSLTDKIFN